MKRLPLGDLVACPKCHGACRIGSRYHEANEGRCHRCNEDLSAGAVTHQRARAARRSFVITEPVVQP